MNREDLAKDLTIAAIARLDLRLDDNKLGQKIAKLYEDVLNCLPTGEPGDQSALAIYENLKLKKLSKEEIKEQFEALNRTLK